MSSKTEHTRPETALSDAALEKASGGHQLERAFVKSWSISGDADDRPTEEVAFYYNKIAFRYAATDAGKVKP